MIDLIEKIKSVIEESGGLECYSKIIDAEVNLNQYQADKVKMIVYISACRFKKINRIEIAANLNISIQAYYAFFGENKAEIINLISSNTKGRKKDRGLDKKPVKITDTKTGNVMTFTSIINTASFFNLTPAAISFDIKNKFKVLKQFKAEYLQT